MGVAVVGEVLQMLTPDAFASAGAGESSFSAVMGRASLSCWPDAATAGSSAPAGAVPAAGDADRPPADLQPVGHDERTC